MSSVPTTCVNTTVRQHVQYTTVRQTYGPVLGALRLTISIKAPDPEPLLNNAAMHGGRTRHACSTSTTITTNYTRHVTVLLHKQSQRGKTQVPLQQDRWLPRTLTAAISPSRGEQWSTHHAVEAFGVRFLLYKKYHLLRSISVMRTRRDRYIAPMWAKRAGQKRMSSCGREGIKSSVKTFTKLQRVVEKPAVLHDYAGMILR